MKTIYQIKDYFEENKEVRIDYFLEHKALLPHAHEFWELSYVCENQGKSYVEEKSPVDIRRGNYLLISPGCTHCITSPDADSGKWVKVCNLLIRPEYMCKIFQNIMAKLDGENNILWQRIKNQESFCVQLYDENAFLHQMLLAVFQEYRFSTWGSQEMMTNFIENIMITSIRSFEQEKNDRSGAVNKHEVIDKIIRYLQINFSYPITLDYLAAYAHLSPEYLARYFKKTTGTTIFTFLTNIRMEHAKILLRTTEQTINEISISCGYQSVGNFQKAFKKAEGMNAGEYRAWCRNSC